MLFLPPYSQGFVPPNARPFDDAKWQKEKHYFVDFELFPPARGAMGLTVGAPRPV